MTAILRTESGSRVRGSVVLLGAFALIGLFLFAAFPGFADEAELVEETFPDALVVVFGFEEIHTIEGFVGGHVYPLLWVLFTGIYFAYTGAGLVAGDIDSRRMDLLLASPVSRESVLLQKVATLWVPLVVLNVGLFAVVLAGAFAVGEWVDPVTLAWVHLLSVPYLLVCAGVGVVLSVTVGRRETAELGALGAVFVLWLVDGIAELSPEYEWVGRLTPSRYYDPSGVLVHGETPLLDAGLLLGTFLLSVVVATTVFVRRDI